MPQKRRSYPAELKATVPPAEYEARYDEQATMV